jgi:hypothetical protein
MNTTQQLLDTILINNDEHLIKYILSFITCKDCGEIEDTECICIRCEDCMAQILHQKCDCIEDNICENCDRDRDYCNCITCSICYNVEYEYNILCCECGNCELICEGCNECRNILTKCDECQLHFCGNECEECNN